MKQLARLDCVLGAHHSGQREFLFAQHTIHFRAIQYLQIRVFAQERRRRVEHICDAVISNAAHERNARRGVSFGNLAKSGDGQKRLKPGVLALRRSQGLKLALRP